MENKPSEHFSNRITMRPTKGPAYEMIKQTMLAQDATLRSQKYLMSFRSQGKEIYVNSQGRKAQKVGRPVGQGMKKPSENFMKGKNLACGSNGVSLRHSNSESTKRMLDIQVPADACADDSDDDSDDDVVMMWYPINDDSVLGTNANLNIEGSSHMNRNGITGLEPPDVSAVNVLSKEVVGSSSTMKRIDFPTVGTSSSQNQSYSSGRMNLNLPSLEDNFEEKHVGAASGSKFFAANEETWRSNSCSHKKDDRSNDIHNKSGVDSSTAHYLSSSSIINPQIFAASSSNAALKYQWQSSSTDCRASRQYADAEMHFAQNDRLPAVQEYCGLHSSVIPGGQFQKHSPFYDCPKDVDLNNGPQDANTTLGQASESTPMEISWVRNKLLNMRKEVSMKKSQVALSCANVHSQILPGSMAYSEGSRRIFGCTVSAATKRDSEPSSTVHMGTDITALIKGIANMQIQSQKKKDDTNGRDLMDLNVALPFMDDMEMDVHQSEGNNSVPQEPNAPCIDLNVALPFMSGMEIDTRQSGGDTVPQAPDDPSNEVLAITAAENLIAMHNDEFQARSPHVNDILHWFADLTISAGENTVFYNTESNNGDGSEALKLQLFGTKDSVYSSALYTQDRKSNEDHVSAAAPTFKASAKANSSTETPSEDGHPEGHYSGGALKARRRSLRKAPYKANSSTATPPEVAPNARRRSLRSFRGKK
ncbi:uncharacterized protein LOC124651258 isoform X2 [Lolium rigidum]|uniref:uncharacterized protein LOC124651258 isoform X2 n=1 Tax=Lolium rigidum TaxID=89674 RepID=UPI001F5D4AE8|nr:uncharacterized protein LOC124651258 isoform X2 [Lolium rigidum]